MYRKILYYDWISDLRFNVIECVVEEEEGNYYEYYRLERASHQHFFLLDW